MQPITTNQMSKTIKGSNKAQRETVEKAEILKKIGRAKPLTLEERAARLGRIVCEYGILGRDLPETEAIKETSEL